MRDNSAKLLLFITMLCASFALCGASAFAAKLEEAELKKIANSLQEKYDSLQSLEVQFTQVLLHKESGGKETRTGVLSFKKNMLVRWETVEPTEELLLVTKTEIWNVFPEEEVAYKYPLALVEDSRNIIRVITGQAKLDADFTVTGERMDDGMIKLLLLPHEPVQALTEATLLVDPKSFLIKRCVFYDFYGNENDIAFTKETLNPPLDESLFSYTPSDAIYIEDRTSEEGIKKQLLN